MPAERQSPLDIPRAAPRHREGIAWAYRTTRIRVGHNPWAVQFDCEPDSAIVVQGTRYVLRQFHVHAPGEHTFDDIRWPMELHLVHQADDGRLAVVGVMLEVDGHHAQLARAFDLLAASPTAVASLDPETLLPSERTFVAYEGSLTTPPFSEGVAWCVMTQPIGLSTAQLDALRALHDDNARPLQPMAGRPFE